MATWQTLGELTRKSWKMFDRRKYPKDLNGLSIVHGLIGQ